MRENTMKTKWANGETTVGAWLSLPEPLIAEAVAQMGFDWICVDMQHGISDYDGALRCLQAISTSDVPPIVRVPWNEPGIIGRMLDAGAMGIIVPMVNTVEEAKAAVAACRYAPAGSRSFGPIRASMYAGADYFDGANDAIACVPMIETKQAVADLDNILDVPGIDAVYVGPADLAITYGLQPGLEQENDEYNAALEKIIEACNARGIVPGIHSNGPVGVKRVAQGFRMVTISGDMGAIAAGMRRDLGMVRDASADPEGEKRVY